MDAPASLPAKWGRAADAPSLSSLSARPVSEQQLQAVRRLLSRFGQVMVLTGGPGTGKNLYCPCPSSKYVESAPAIRASFAHRSRGQAIVRGDGPPPRTIHRLLEFFNRPRGIQAQRRKPAAIDLLIVDERHARPLVGRTYLPSKRSRLAPPPGCSVGDVDLLPSVGAGDVLRDVIASGRAEVIRLDVIFRQAQGSLIITQRAIGINKGQDT